MTDPLAPTAPTNLSYASAADLLALMQRRELSPTELMHHTLDRIGKLDGAINSVVRLDAERALAEAADATERIARGAGTGPLTGLPLLVKDAEDAAGFPTSHGTRAFRDAPPATRDTIHVGRLREAGAIVIGRTNMPPMGAGIHTANDAFGITRNPWNTERSPGGSSGGSAAAVAAGLVALATAGDGGGSTRIPAALCGVIGLKPSRGRIPQGPSRFPVWPRHTVLGAITRTVRDAALHLDIAAGHHPADPDSLPAPGLSYQACVDGAVPRLRVGVLRTLGVADPRPEILEAVDRAADDLRGHGHQVTDDESALPQHERFPASILLRQQVLAHYRLTSRLDAFTTRRDDFEPWFADVLAHGGALTTEDFTRYWEHRARLDQWAADLFTRYDMLLMPTVPTTAWPAEGPDVATAVRERTIPIAFTSVFNDTGNPAISIPAGLAPDGLPRAVQLVAAHHREDLLLGVASLLEEPGDRAHPPVPGNGQAPGR
ncbi:MULTISPECIES: amidase [unclassified Streptomyces]|uniref:amidase n=1 Tax=unclassified Streptomyces TaxID=2593676 RepID=UPI000F5B956E|nr:amidase [Streptomyces sp. ADI95-17]RPK68700.1 Acylamidase [Streptomyces sp. ADI95-17]WSX02500.1 amidase [Streptomyces sp. NBC_00987]